MSKFQLSFSLDNEAFAENAASEISRVLKTISDDFKNEFFNSYSIPYETNIRDVNGNKIGSIKISNDQEKAVYPNEWL